MIIEIVDFLSRGYSYMKQRGKMKKYVVYNEQVFDVFESSGRFVIKDKNIDEATLKEIFLLSKSIFFENMLSAFIDKEIPLSWIKVEYIQDKKFVEQYYPEFLI